MILILVPELFFEGKTVSIQYQSKVHTAIFVDVEGSLHKAENWTAGEE